MGVFMKKSGLLVLLLMVFVSGGCKEDVPEKQTPQAGQPAASAEIEATDDETPVASEGADENQRVELKLELPDPKFIGTPENLSGIDNLEPDTKQARPAFYVPSGVANVSLNKPVTSSEMDPFIGSLEMIVDGDKNATEGSVVELGPFEQWVQIDLEDEYEIYAILLWHFHLTPRVYFDVVVQVSNDEEFITGVKTLFNNDIDNSLGKGVGTDMHYIDKAEGKLIDGKGTEARYVRLYSQGNNQNDYTHYIEVEVFGR